MTIVAPLSKYKKDGYRIIIAILLVIGGIFAYDGYLSKYEWSMRHKFYREHVIDNDGEPDSDMIFNRKAPPFFIGAAVLVALYYMSVRNRKIVAEEDALVVGGRKVMYDTIEKIDKTYFDSKGYFVVTYKNSSGGDVELKLSDRSYDNLPSVLDELVRQIS